MLKTAVKASGVSNLTDARYFAAWQVDWLGFNLTPEGLETLSLPAVKEIKDWIEGPKIVGEIQLSDLDAAQQIINYLSLEMVQVDATATIQELNGLQVNSIIKEVKIGYDTTLLTLKKELDKYLEVVDYFMLDLQQFYENGPLNILKLIDICQHYEILLRADFTKTNIIQVINEIKPAGISVEGGIEEKVGVKAFDTLDEIFEKLVVD